MAAVRPRRLLATLATAPTLVGWAAPPRAGPSAARARAARLPGRPGRRRGLRPDRCPRHAEPLPGAGQATVASGPRGGPASPTARLRRRAAASLLAAAALVVCGRPASAAARPDAARAAAPTGRAPGAGSPFAVRGVVEGYYGPPWSLPATEDVLAFMGAHGMNTFVYAPKFDPYQRAQWYKPYPPAQLRTIATMVQSAQRAGVDFVYSISPGLSIVYSSPTDRAELEAKLAQLRSVGVHTFMLSFDDIGYNLNSPRDVALYDNSLSRAQVALTDAVYAAEKRADARFHLMFTPTDYDGTAPNVYLEHIARLPRAIDIIWTGPGVVSPTITAADADAIARILGRPPLIWYNYPVNDWTVPSAEFAHPAAEQPQDLFLGPVRGLAPDLGAHVRGLLANPMLEPYASEIPLATVAAYLDDPAGWNASAAWQRALAAAGGPVRAQLATFARAERPYPEVLPDGRYAWSSTDPATDRLEAQVLAAFAARPTAVPRLAAAAQLRATFSAWVRDAPALRALPNPALTAEIAPWVAWMPREGRYGLDALALLDDLAAGEAARAAAERTRLEADAAALAGADVQFGGQLLPFLRRVLALR